MRLAWRLINWSTSPADGMSRPCRIRSFCGAASSCFVGPHRWWESENCLFTATSWLIFTVLLIHFLRHFFLSLTATPGGMITGDLLAGAWCIHIFLIEEFIPEQVVADFLVFFFTGYEGCRHIVGVGIARASIFFVSEMIRITANWDGRACVRS